MKNSNKIFIAILVTAIIIAFVIVRFFSSEYLYGEPIVFQDEFEISKKQDQELSDPTPNEIKKKFIGDLNMYGDPTSGYFFENGMIYYTNNLGYEDQGIKLLKGSLEPMMGYVTYEYAKIDDQIYYQGARLNDVDSEKFKPIENGTGVHHYGTDNINVYWESKIITDANPKTFTPISKNMWEGCDTIGYSKDDKRVFFESVTVPGADPATFESLMNSYGKDKRGYYFGAKYVGPTVDESELYCAAG